MFCECVNRALKISERPRVGVWVLGAVERVKEGEKEEHGWSNRVRQNSA